MTSLPVIEPVRHAATDALGTGDVQRHERMKHERKKHERQ
jgi:hypothetical protein